MTFSIQKRCRWFLPALVVSLALTAGFAQADVATYEAVLSGDQEVPPVASAASGSMTLTVDTNTLEATWTLQFADLSSPQTGAHIHHAPFGANGGVVLGLPNGSPVNGVWTLTAAQHTELAAGNYYVNVHTAEFPAGEIRGQLFRTSIVGNEDLALDAIKALYR